MPECRQIASTCRAFPGVAAPCPGKRSAGRPRAEPLCRRGKTPRPGRTGCHVPLSCPRKPPRISASGPISAPLAGPILKQNARRGQIPGRRAALPVFGGKWARRPQNASKDRFSGLLTHPPSLRPFSANPTAARGGTFAIPQTTDRSFQKTGCRPQRTGLKRRSRSRFPRPQAAQGAPAPGARRTFSPSCPVSVPCQCQC